MNNLDDLNKEADCETCKYEELGFDRIANALSIISGKWTLKLLYIIGFHKVIRYGEIRRQAAPITHKMLSTQLKELEKNGLIIRTEYPQVPPKVEYSLSDKGWGLFPMFDSLFNWIVEYDV